MLTNVKEFVKKHDVLCVIILLVIIIAAITCRIELILDADEIWDFQNIYKMYNGYEIYKDVNVIITPLFFKIGELLFKILGANLFVYRVYNVLINTIIYIYIYAIFKELKFSKRKSIIYVFTILLACKQTITSSANYNSLAILFFIIGIYLNLKSNKNWIIHGIIIFLIFMSKQNIGIYYILGMLLKLILVKKVTKDNMIEFWKEICVFIFLFIIYCIYLYLQGNLYYFISYCFLGIYEFGSKNLQITIMPTAVLILVTLITVITKIIIRDKLTLKINIIECFAFPMLLIAYPIFNTAHCYIAWLGIIIELILILDMILLNDFLEEIPLKVIMCIILITMLGSIFFITKTAVYIKQKPYKFKEFFGVEITKKQEENIEKIIDYINNNNNNKTVIFGVKAPMYNIVLKQNNEVMDLPLLGNFGKDGEDGMLKQIQELKNTNILIEKNEDDIFWQESKKIRKWIQENLNCIGEIENFLIYEIE